MAFEWEEIQSGDVIKSSKINQLGQGIIDIEDEISKIADKENIIDITLFPTSDIDENAIYRLIKGTCVYRGFIQNQDTVIIVDELPEVGENVTIDMEKLTIYYSLQDKNAYGYVSNEAAVIFGIPAGWYEAAVLAQATGVGTYGGVITDMRQSLDDNTMYILLEYEYYKYTTAWGWIGENKTQVGWHGTALAAEVFNNPTLNHAGGNASHAEGWDTAASGATAHSEGMQTSASGAFSHSEGAYTEAQGDSSHSEGRHTFAVADNTHAEGYDTYAEGANSHTEGKGTCTFGDNQHAEGKYNIIDESGIYAHIVGNGSNPGNRSNAHTLDWNGNAWFAGNVTDGNNNNLSPSIIADSQPTAIIPMDIRHNTINRYFTDLTKLTFVFPTAEYSNYFSCEISFNSGATATEVVYSGSGILNWVGTDCSLSGGISLFTPQANMHYDIIIYFNGTQFVSVVNGFEAATGNTEV